MLDAALRAFAQRGFEGESIREVAGEVAVGHNLVRHYLGSNVNLRVLGVFVFGAAFSPLTFEGFASRLGFTSPKPGQPLDDHVEAMIDMIVAGMSRSSD